MADLKKLKDELVAEHSALTQAFESAQAAYNAAKATLDAAKADLVAFRGSNLGVLKALDTVQVAPKEQ